MGLISIDNLETGMVLASDLNGPNGRMLLKANTVLGNKHLRVLKIWGVTEADVQGFSQADIAAVEEGRVDSGLLEASRSYQLNRFRYADLEHEAVIALFRVCVLRHSQRIAPSVAREVPAGFSEPPSRDVSEDGQAKTSLEDILRNEGQLATLPDVFQQINAVLRNPKSSAAAVADVVGQDPNLTAMLLKLVNSLYYGFPTRIDTLLRAVTVIGTKDLLVLALGACVVSMFKDIPPDLVDLRSFWRYSISCAIISRFVAEKRGLSGDRFFVAGLLCDIGRLVLYKNHPAIGRRLLTLASTEGRMLSDVEQEVLGFSHARIGSSLMKTWRFPSTLVGAVRYQNNPEKAQSMVEPSIIHLAEVATLALEVGSSGDTCVPPLNIAAWEVTGLPTTVFSTIAALVDQYLEDVLHYFLPEGSSSAAKGQ